ncbi:hypothetical protein [Hymenobacter arizonensis]|uniref:Uncharacterized protein n=1 Tax=Hymenobacter arizonensis TaxID=1227077 RepID=A0A1I5SIL0_HYMAR|nr:hypothetical protein [Hymenobacter arizonensis]SFP70549.1 hypothetical protein SAMN04515668_0072 [Hymenobacter arizonensis]
MALTSFAFQQARVKLVLFKSRLRSVLYGVREAEPELFSIRDNPLGQWIQATLKPALRASTDVRDLEHLVQQMLQTGQDLATRYSRGQIEESRADLELVNAFATQIEVVLTRLEAGVKLAA